MKKINSENLWEFVNNLATNQKVKFKVFYDDDYITEIFWNGNYFEWEESTFTSEAFFNALYDFVVIEDDDKLENKKMFKLNKFVPSQEYIMTDKNVDLDNKIEMIRKRFYSNELYMLDMVNKINEIIDHINKIEEEMRK